MTKNEKDTFRRKIERLRVWLLRKRGLSSITIPEITASAYLAHHGLLGSVFEMWLRDVDLTSIPAEHLASLASCVTQFFFIINVSNIISILDNVKCQCLIITRQTLNSEETRALVRAMESGVEKVQLGGKGEVSLDITTLTQYSGAGRCGEVMCYDDTARSYRKEVETWAMRINWDIWEHPHFEMCRNAEYSFK